MVFFHVLFRFIHVGSVILLLGGMVYARLVLVPTLNSLPEDLRLPAASRAQISFRGILYGLLVLIVGSGIYNLVTGPKHGEDYQIWFGVKMLLAAHFIATAILWSTSPYGDVSVNRKSKHRLISASISGLAIVLVAAYLKSLTQRGL